MAAFVEILDQPTEECTIIFKASANDAWEAFPTVFPNEAQATLEAIALMGAPQNCFATRVMLPNGNLFKEAI